MIALPSPQACIANTRLIRDGGRGRNRTNDTRIFNQAATASTIGNGKRISRLAPTPRDAP